MQLLTDARLEIPTKLAPAFAKMRSAIERDDFKSPDVKKLVGHPFFRAKLDYENRVLLQFVTHGSERACLALELIEQHAYDRSRFLRGARLDESRALEASEATLEEAGRAASPVRYLHPGRTEFHMLDRPLSFDDRQEEIVALGLPMVLVGCAGSGKTAVTLTKLRELSGDVLYVTQSAYLAESSAALYFAHGYENERQRVDFLSYRALLEGVEVPAGRAVTLKDFRALFARHEAQLRFTTAHQLFEELRGVLTAEPRGVLSLQDYEALGVRQSIYGPSDRPKVHAFFGRYREWLTEAKLYDPNLVAHAYRPRAPRRYDAVVVDEVQDLTNAELALVLATLKDPRGFLLCGDANQIVHPNFFSWSKVKSLFYTREEDAVAAPIHVLEVNYRSSRAVCGVANTLLKIKNARFGSVDRESTALVRPASMTEGRVVGLVKKDSVLRDLNERTRASARVAVVVLSDDQKAEARQRFGTPLIFTVHEAKGLEYDAVILFDLVSAERARFQEIALGVEAADLDRDELTYARAKEKADKSLEIYKFYVNALYVALTRAVETVYVVESDARHPLLGLLRIACTEDVSQVSSSKSSLEDWQKEARRLELQGKQEQADAIRKSILRVSPVPWPRLDRPGFLQAYERTFAPNSVFGKAKQHLFEFASFHELTSLAMAVERAGHRAQRSPKETRRLARERAMGHYDAGDRVKVIAEVERYGIEHRCMMGLTPLMMAADAGQLGLTELLVERGARLDAVDSLGRMPIHFAVRRAFTDGTFAEETLGPMFELLCPTAFEVEVDGRRERLARSQGEFFVLLFLMARFHGLYAKDSRRRGGFTAKMFDDAALGRFPRSVVSEWRRRREYWNGVLARAEVDASYRPARRLWRRERMGSYVPSSVVSLKVASPGAEPGSTREEFVRLDELMAVARLDTAG